MAAMRKEQRDIAGLGPIGILREGLKVYRANAKTFILIQLTLMLPLAVLVLGLNFLVLSNLPVPLSLNGQSPGDGLVSLWPQLDPFLMLFDPALLQLDLLLVVLIASAFTYGFLLPLSLAQSASLYSLGLHYAGHPIAYTEVLRAATPRLWMRMAVTNTWFSVVALFLNLIGTWSALIFAPVQLPFGVPLGLCTAFAVMVVGVYPTMVFTIAPGVSVLEEAYGWAAARKSMKLLKGPTISVALWFHVLLLVPKFMGVAIGWYVVSQLNKGDFSAWSGAQLLLITAVYLAWTIIAWQIEYLCSGVQYVSFKAYHDESLADPFFQKMNGVFVAVGDGSNMAILGEKETGILV